MVSVRYWTLLSITLLIKRLEGRCSRPGLCMGPAEGNTPISRGK